MVQALFVLRLLKVTSVTVLYCTVVTAVHGYRTVPSIPCLYKANTSRLVNTLQYYDSLFFTDIFLWTIVVSLSSECVGVSGND